MFLVSHIFLTQLRRFDATGGTGGTERCWWPSSRWPWAPCLGMAEAVLDSRRWRDSGIPMPKRFGAFLLKQRLTKTIHIYIYISILLHAIEDSRCLGTTQWCFQFDLMFMHLHPAEWCFSSQTGFRGAASTLFLWHSPRGLRTPPPPPQLQGRHERCQRVRGAWPGVRSLQERSRPRPCLPVFARVLGWVVWGNLELRAAFGCLHVVNKVDNMVLARDFGQVQVLKAEVKHKLAASYVLFFTFLMFLLVRCSLRSLD